MIICQKICKCKKIMLRTKISPNIFPTPFHLLCRLLRRGTKSFLFGKPSEREQEEMDRGLNNQEIQGETATGRFIEYDNIWNLLSLVNTRPSLFTSAHKSRRCSSKVLFVNSVNPVNPLNSRFTFAIIK